MPYIEAQNGGGGSMSETVLWSNPNTGADLADITISNLDFTGYSVIRFYWKYSKLNDDSTATYIDVTKDNWDNMGGASQTGIVLGIYGGSVLYGRYITRPTTTSIKIYQNYRMGGTTQAAPNAIPIKITGLK